MENIISSFIFKLRNEFEIGLERIPAALFLSFIHFQIGNSDEASFVLPTVQYIKRCRLLKRRSNQTPFIVRLGDLESILTHCASILIETLWSEKKSYCSCMRTSFYICTTRLPHIGSDKDVAINESHAAVNVPYKSKLLAKLKKKKKEFTNHFGAFYLFIFQKQRSI